jgi:hypothetical protein
MPRDPKEPEGAPVHVQEPRGDDEAVVPVPPVEGGVPVAAVPVVAVAVVRAAPVEAHHSQGGPPAGKQQRAAQAGVGPVRDPES